VNKEVWKKSLTSRLTLPAAGCIGLGAGVLEPASANIAAGVLEPAAANAAASAPGSVVDGVVEGVVDCVVGGVVTWEDGGSVG